MRLSVILCTYNPDAAILERCLDGMARAAGRYRPHEIIIVDNNSPSPVSDMPCVKTFLSAMDNARVVVERKQGLTPARITGIRVSTGDLILYVDDDNFLADDYYAVGVDIAEKNPHIGSWSGQVELIFEKEPEPWVSRYQGLLVSRSFQGDHWSNDPHLDSTMPCGAGMYLRRSVGDHYLQLHDGGHREIQLDRSGSSLMSGGDNDLAACACDIGLGVGLFAALKLGHFITARRTTKDYLLRLAEGIAASSIVFKSFRGVRPEPLTTKTRVANTLRKWLKSGVDKEFHVAVLRGEEIGRAMLSSQTVQRPS